MEIERKYLIDRLPENLEQYECKHGSLTVEYQEKYLQVL